MNRNATQEGDDVVVLTVLVTLLTNLFVRINRLVDEIAESTRCQTKGIPAPYGEEASVATITETK
jgi:hypothetical protein